MAFNSCHPIGSIVFLLSNGRLPLLPIFFVCPIPFAIISCCFLLLALLSRIAACSSHPSSPPVGRSPPLTKLIQIDCAIHSFVVVVALLKIAAHLPLFRSFNSQPTCLLPASIPVHIPSIRSFQTNFLLFLLHNAYSPLLVIQIVYHQQLNHPKRIQDFFIQSINCALRTDGMSLPLLLKLCYDNNDWHSLFC